jgi:hypothetical protein
MVDRIGKGGPVPPTTTSKGAERPQETGKTFEVEKPAPTKPTQPVESATALEQLKAGKINFDAYLEAKVTEATRHLEGLSPVQLDTIRSMLRDRMATDAELADLLKQATGHVPSPSPEKDE